MDARVPLANFLRGLVAKGSSPNTVRSYGMAIGSWLVWIDDRGGDWAQPTRAEARAYAAHLIDGLHSGRLTQRHRMSALRSFYAWCLRNDLDVAGRALTSVQLPRIGSRLPRVLELKAVETLLDQAAVLKVPSLRSLTAMRRPLLDMRDSAILEVMYAGGFRIAEVCAARLDGLDLERRRLRVLGKGDKWRIGLLNQHAAKALALYLRRGRPLLLEGRPDTGIIFLNKFGTPDGAGAARPLQPSENRDLHPRHPRPEPGGLPGRSSASEGAGTIAEARGGLGWGGMPERRPFKEVHAHGRDYQAQVILVRAEQGKDRVVRADRIAVARILATGGPFPRQLADDSRPELRRELCGHVRCSNRQRRDVARLDPDFADEHRLAESLALGQARCEAVPLVAWHRR
jgi:site-specific recombinase XerD